MTLAPGFCVHRTELKCIGCGGGLTNEEIRPFIMNMHMLRVPIICVNVFMTIHYSKVYKEIRLNDTGKAIFVVQFFFEPESPPPKIKLVKNNDWWL